MTTVNNYSFANNFYDSCLDTAFASQGKIDVINFNGLDNLNQFITKSSAYINNLYDFFQEMSSLERQNLKKTAALISKYEKTFTNKDTIPKNWNESVHDPLLLLLKKRNINSQKYLNSIESDVQYHLKTIQGNIDSNLASSMLKLQSFKQNMIQSYNLIKTKSSKLEQNEVRLRQLDLNLQVANGPGYGQKQLQKLIKEQDNQVMIINDLKSDIQKHQIDFDCLLKNYKQKWVEITDAIQEEQFKRYQYCLELINNSFEKGFDDLMTQSLHDLESLKFKLIDYDFEKDLKWLAFKFGSGYINMQSPSAHKHNSPQNTTTVDDTLDNANNFMDKHITMGLNNQTTHDQYEQTGFVYDEPESTASSNDTFFQKQPINNASTVSNKNAYFQKQAMYNTPDYDQKRAMMGNISELDLPNGLDKVQLGSMRYSSLSSHAILNDDNSLSTIEHTEKNTFKTKGHGSVSSDGDSVSHKEQMRLMMKSIGTIDGVNWRNRRQKIVEQKAKAPELPPRKENLFWSDEEQDDQKSTNSSVDNTEMQNQSQITHVSEGLPEAYEEYIPDVSYQKLENPNINEKEDEHEDGDLTMLTNAVQKMKERKYKRKSVLHDLDTTHEMEEYAQSDSKPLKVFVPHHR